jgi:hypothetical protein
MCTKSEISFIWIFFFQDEAEPHSIHADIPEVWDTSRKKKGGERAESLAPSTTDSSYMAYTEWITSMIPEVHCLVSSQKQKGVHRCNMTEDILG